VTEKRQPGWARLDDQELHALLCERAVSEDYRTKGWVPGQAFACPYFIPLSGSLGSDWGVIVNPASERFGMLTFEHDDCGCAERDDLGDGPVHQGTPIQAEDAWSNEWVDDGTHSWT
jgi:hypothetical protein